MKNSPVLRQIDNLGRVVIPRDIRRQMDLKCGDEILLEVDGNKLVILKAQNRCILCNSKRDLLSLNDKYVCRECVKLLSAEEKGLD